MIDELEYWKWWEFTIVGGYVLFLVFLLVTLIGILFNFIDTSIYWILSILYLVWSIPVIAILFKWTEEREVPKQDPPFSEASQKSEGDENER